MAPETATAHITASTSLLPAIQAWEIYLQDQSRSHFTIKAFCGDLELLASFLPPDRTLGVITTQELNNFINWLQNGRNVPCSPKSLARRITSIKSFFRWLQKSGVLINDPAEKILQQSVISPIPVVLTPEEEEKVRRVAGNYRSARKPDARPYLLLALLLETGVKKGECLTINLNHIDLNATNGPVLFVRYANPQNRYKERKISLSEEWVNAYKEYQAQYKPVDRVFSWSPRRLEYLLEDIGKEAGLDKHLSFDMCRWTCALNDWRSDLEKDQIRQKLGISKIQWREISLKLRQLADAQITAEAEPATESGEA
ncbi:MAG: site-specific integrase [Anaerolineae bacterium]|nr:site-specific integrase [Anaerolineae bacterium]